MFTYEPPGKLDDLKGRRIGEPLLLLQTTRHRLTRNG